MSSTPINHLFKLDKMKQFVGLTKDDYVVCDRQISHMDLHPVPTWALMESLDRITVGERNFIVEEISFDRPIGTTTCVKTTQQDEIVFARRLHRDCLTRFVRFRQPEPCNTMVVVLKRDESVGQCVLITAYVGKKGEVSPGDWKAHSQASCPLTSYQASVAYWADHALVYDPQIIVPGSETVHPW